jgi:Uma2 family endonuclease
MVVAAAPLKTTKPTKPDKPKVPAGRKLITGEALTALGDISPCELIDGRIVRKNPTGRSHAVLISNLVAALSVFARPRKLGQVLSGEVGIYTRRSPDSVRAADIAFVSRARLAGLSANGYLTVAPELIVEVTSPADRWQDVRQKLEEYFAIGVQRVWIVEPDKRTMLVYSASVDVRAYREGDILIGEGVLEGFTLPIGELFED